MQMETTFTATRNPFISIGFQRFLLLLRPLTTSLPPKSLHLERSHPSPGPRPLHSLPTSTPPSRLVRPSKSYSFPCSVSLSSFLSYSFSKVTHSLIKVSPSPLFVPFIAPFNYLFCRGDVLYDVNKKFLFIFYSFTHPKLPIQLTVLPFLRYSIFFSLFRCFDLLISSINHPPPTLCFSPSLLQYS